MNLLYDPKKRRPKAWTIAIILLVPIILVFIFLTVGSRIKKDIIVDQDEVYAKPDDVFKKF